MANPFASSGSSSSSSMMLPLMMMSMMNSAPSAPAQAPMAPQGSPDMFKKPAGTSFAGGAAAVPTSNQLGGKSLLGG